VKFSLISRWLFGGRLLFFGIEVLTGTFDRQEVRSKFFPGSGEVPWACEAG
jgi:hypothetical protein